MIVRFKPEPDREKFGFQRAVRKTFSFLEPMGFQIVDDLVTFVRFESNDCFMNVYHGRGSYELGVEVGRKIIPDTRYRLPDVLRVLAPEFASEASYQASNPGAVVNCVQKLGNLTKQYCGPLWSGSEQVWEEIDWKRSVAAIEETKKYTLGSIREKAQEAWRHKDYRRVVDAYEQMLADLTEVERKRLSFATKHLH